MGARFPFFDRPRVRGGDAMSPQGYSRPSVELIVQPDAHDVEVGVTEIGIERCGRIKPGEPYTQRRFR